MPKQPRRKQQRKRSKKPRAAVALVQPATSAPSWRVGSARLVASMVEIHEPIGALHRLVVSGLPVVSARELIETVAATPDLQDTLIHAAAPSMHTASPQGRLSVGESDRLLQVGRLFTILEAVFGSAAEARNRLRSPLSALGNRSPLERSGSVTGLEHSCVLLVPQGIKVLLEDAEASQHETFG